jgi:hypothetical protein
VGSGVGPWRNSLCVPCGELSSDADSLIDTVRAGIKKYSLYELTEERDRIESLRNSLENDTGAIGYTLITLFVACHVSVEEAKAEFFCGAHRSCNGE